MIAYYIHHQGRGHLARATAIAAALGGEVTGLSSLPRPMDWPGEWVDLPLDTAETPEDPDAGGRLHWVPIGSEGLRERSALIAQWIAAHDPAVCVVDVSVEVALLVRLHGVPVIVFALPGQRTDDAHRLGFAVATKILAAWPSSAAGMVSGMPLSCHHKVVPVGAIGGSRVREGAADAGSNLSHAVVLGGAGGDEFHPGRVAVAREQTHGWSWVHLGRSGTWVSDVSSELRRADVVITHAGEGALADVSAAQVPAVVIPQDRPYREQHITAEELRRERWPALVLDRWPLGGWPDLLTSARSLDGALWHDWNDGAGATRAAAEILAVASNRRS